MAPYKRITEIPDPRDAPDQWTKEALAIRALSVLNGQCPQCAGQHVRVDDRTIIDHADDCPGHEMNLHAYTSEHGYDLRKINRLVYGIDDDGGFHPLFIVGE
jgi:hypothetical protein